MNARNVLMLRIQQGAVAALLSTLTAAYADVPEVVSQGVGAVIRCGTSAAGKAVNAAHADKIIFQLSGALPAADPDDQAALNAVPRDTELDIKVRDNPTTVADLKGKVLTFLGAVDNAATRQNVKIINVVYAMVCPTTAAP
jgi:hypothetical protein